MLELNQVRVPMVFVAGRRKTTKGGSLPALQRQGGKILPVDPVEGGGRFWVVEGSWLRFEGWRGVRHLTLDPSPRSRRRGRITAARAGAARPTLIGLSESKKWETDFYRILPLPGVLGG
jgi:hypothetical protein